MDGLLLHALCSELQSLIGAKISKIYQPNEYDLLLQLRHQSSNLKLLLSAHPVYARVHLTNRAMPNPTEPPMFCMLLRKYLENGVIETVAQVSLERVLMLTIRHYDDLGDVRRKQFIIEIMGRHSNIILLDPERGIILDGIRHITPSVSSHRVVMPGFSYVAPPSQHDKLNLLETEREQWLTALQVGENSAAHERFLGFSPLLSQLLEVQPNIEEQVQTLYTWKQALLHGDWTPSLAVRDKRVLHIFSWPHSYRVEQTYASLSEALDTYYGERAQLDQLRQRSADMTRFLQTELAKNESKRQKLQRSLLESEQADEYRMKGELLTASLHLVTRGAKSVEVVNYYDEQQALLTIMLDPTLSPADNAQRLFRKYSKLKNSVQFIAEQTVACDAEIRYFRGLLQQLEQAEFEVMEEIREELIEQGYIRKRAKPSNKKKRDAKKDSKPNVLSVRSSEGVTISVGRNNKQNDYVTMKLARNTDTWLHTKDIPGSHVVIHATAFGEQTLKEAAHLAAYYSQGRASSHVPVDYTLVRHVHKPSGAKPGYVIYEQQKTLYITPDASLVESMVGR